MGRILALDVGTVRIGVAVSDLLGITAQPLGVIQRKKTNPWQEVLKLIEEHEVEIIVVGQPLQLNGQEGLAVAAISKFVDKLREVTTLPIELWDERLSTAQAERMMISAGTRREKRRQNIDKVAAALILESYLNARSLNAGGDSF